MGLRHVRFEDKRMEIISHMQTVIYRSLDHDITIAFPLRRELCQTYKYRYECSLIKNLSIHWKTGEKNRETNKNILAP